MVDRFLDPEGGNDANDGLSFANRKKTLSAFGSVPAGDRVKVIRSPAPTPMGICAWTDNNDRITIPAGLVKVIPGFDQNWIASANVTAASNVLRRNVSNTAATRIAFASAFTTGKAAYYTLPSILDLSAFKTITGYYYFAGTPPSITTLEIRFCSDTTGDVPVFTVPISGSGPTLNSNGWSALKKDNTAALPSNIQSISLYANSDPGAVTLSLDNFIAALDPNDAGAIDHTALFGKNTTDEPWWYNICVFPTDTSVQIGGGSDIQYNRLPRPYRGVTESVTSYSLRMLNFGFSSSSNTFSSSGTAGNQAVLSGGWDAAAMMTQEGVTILDGRYYPTYGLSFGGGYVKVEKIGIANPASMGLNVIPMGSDIQLEGIWGAKDNATGGMSVAFGQITHFRVREVWGFAGNLLNYPGNMPFALDVHIDRVSGCYSGTSPLDAVSNIGHPESSLVIGEVSNCASYGVWANAGSCSIELRGTTFRWNDSGDVYASSAGVVSLINCHLLSSPQFGASVLDNVNSLVLTTAEDGDPTKYRRINGAGTVGSATDQTHSGAGTSLKFMPGSTVRATADSPLQGEIARIAVQAGSPVTVKIWGRRSDAGLSLGIGVKEGYIAGVSEASTHMTAAANTWEQITLAFTPTAAGVLPIYGYAYGGTTFSGWLDDLSIDQKEYIELDLLSGVPDMFTFARASKAWDFNSAGVLTEFADGVARQAYDPTTLTVRGTRVEPASSTNKTRNPRAEGADAGTNTLPTNWGTYATNGLTRTVVGSGVEDGIPYVDVRWQGTTTGTATATIFPEPNAQIAALTGQTWTGSWFVRLMAGTVASNFALNVIEYTSAGTFVTGNGLNIATVTSAPLRTQRSAWTRTLSGGATVAAVNAPITQSWPVGTVVDVTLRFGVPQIEQAGYASSPILPPVGSPDVSTRATETLTLALPYAGFPGVTGWTAMLEFMPLVLPGNVTALGLGGSSGNFSAGIVGGDNKLYATKSVAGTNVASSGTTTTAAAGAVNKIVMAQDTTDIRASLNGSAVISASNAGYPAMTAVNILSTQPGCARKIRMWLYKLLDADLPGQST